ncbi:50S ribosomal protein L23 [Campylobacter sp. MIT 12-8780]|uniref:50S ribosomal protein L23 n=1 Tax=unclassified Campylobacter TaxID=2593542 RepID=UPI0010F59419|nr:MULTISPECIES: 50S ribosomal protein L23 [unclassified Campylobacter]NDJ27062.1 50S ribosomal protein L23 [Campylobacter sp. MIT 19-121]TKX29714.1 50S ribosomal protein L23 [Campylobacter sp. MIT 12-5580]TQR41638.1 50S ribosomal protein L23 [Campylobacter sp. MIT 12-8780]
MADITDIKSILYTEKSLNLQERGVVVIQTSPKMTKNSLKAVLKEYFGVSAEKINSLRMDGKVKRFRGRIGQRNDYKKFYVKLPEGVSLESKEA